MTQNLSITVQQRVALAEVEDGPLMAVMGKYYALAAQIDGYDPALHSLLNAAWADCVKAVRRVAWLDGWQCGRNPDLLTMAVPMKDGAQ